MTREEAFEQWLITSAGYSGIAINKDDMELAYLAGRNDQKQKDAEICRQQITAVPLNLVAQGFAEAILNQS